MCFFHLWWFSCGGLTGEESLGLFAFEIHSSHARQWLFACLLQIVSHNAAQRQRTEVIFPRLEKLTFTSGHFLFWHLKTLTTEPREKTDRMMRGGRLVIFGVHVCMWQVFESRNEVVLTWKRPRRSLVRNVGHTVKTFSSVSLREKLRQRKGGAVLWFGMTLGLAGSPLQMVQN